MNGLIHWLRQRRTVMHGTLVGAGLMMLMVLQSQPAAAVSDGAVVTSVRPLALIAAALTDGITQPQVLVADGSSPHHYSLKPSDMRRLMDARVVFWVGPELEHFLVKPLSRTQAVTVALHSLAESGQQVHNMAAEAGGDMHHDEHDHGGIDVHPWLDPDKVLPMAQRMHDALLKVFPSQRAVLERNLAQFRQQMRTTDAQIRADFADVKGRGLFVFHDAYAGFIHHYGLKQLGYITVDPSRKPGARHLVDIRQQLEQQPGSCVLSEPQYSNSVIDAIVSGLDVRQEVVDPLATGIKPGPEAYSQFLLGLAQKIRHCLAP